MKKPLFSLIIFALTAAILFVAGCNTQQSGTTTSGDSVGYPMAVTDDLGNKISLPKKPERIISLALTSDEILSAVADQSAICGLSTLSADKFYSNIVEFSTRIPAKYAGKDLEKLIQAKPDLVITSSWVDARDLTRLRDSGIPVFVYKLPDNVDDIRKLIQNIGKITGNDNRAATVVNEMDRRLQAVSSATENIPAAKRLNAIMTDSLFYVFGEDSLSAQLLKITHVNNLAAKIGVTKIENVSKERIVAADPQAIFMSAYSAEENNNLANIYLKDKSFANVTAVKTNRVFVIPNPHLTTASQFIACGAEDIARLAYPELVIKN